MDVINSYLSVMQLSFRDRKSIEVLRRYNIKDEEMFFEYFINLVSNNISVEEDKLLIDLLDSLEIIDEEYSIYAYDIENFIYSYLTGTLEYKDIKALQKAGCIEEKEKLTKEEDAYFQRVLDLANQTFHMKNFYNYVSTYYYSGRFPSYTIEDVYLLSIEISKCIKSNENTLGLDDKTYKLVEKMRAEIAKLNKERKINAKTNKIYSTLIHTILRQRLVEPQYIEAKETNEIDDCLNKVSMEQYIQSFLSVISLEEYQLLIEYYDYNNDIKNICKKYNVTEEQLTTKVNELIAKIQEHLNVKTK